MKCDVLIIGTGLAGLSTAISLSDMTKQKVEIIAVTKNEDAVESNSYYAQGGIVYTSFDDSPSKLKNDIVKAGAGLCYSENVDILCHNGPKLVKEILMDRCDVHFSEHKSGKLDLTEEGAHSTRRIIHVEDTTGKSIQMKMLETAENCKNVQILKNKTAIDLITREHQTNDIFAMYKEPECLGAYVLNNETNKVEKITAKVVVLATGGCGRLYLHTSNPQGAVGDGIAMAYRAGAKIINMEYTQFHPTILYHKDLVGFLISEAVRGEGAILKNRYDKAFMSDYHEQKDLAPRDIVTRAILEEMIKTDDTNVYLDMTVIPKSKIDNHFPNIKNKCLKVGIDIEKEYVPVVPAYHFLCGGIKTDSNARTNIYRLYSIGETSCTGVHGANRLASTSLLESLVFGHRAAFDIWENWQVYKQECNCTINDWIYTKKQENIDIALLIQDWANLKNIMWNYVGPIRSRKRLFRAREELNNIRRIIENFYRDSIITKDIIELRNAVQTALTITHHSWMNKTSRGCHFRIN